MSFSVADRARSFRHAGRGIALLLTTQHNAWIHAAISVAVVAVGAAVGLHGADWCLLVLAMALVWTAEALNTALELVCDVASPEFHPLVKQAKDVAAGAVLLSAVGAAVVGVLVLWQPVTALFV